MKSRNARSVRVDASEWMRCSISIQEIVPQQWEKSPHPAAYPVEHPRRFIRCCMANTEGIVLDPFLGSGSTLIAATQERLSGVGFEIVPEYAELAYRRLLSVQLPLALDWSSRSVTLVREKTHLDFPPQKQTLFVVNDDARAIRDYLPPESVDMVVTSPPYWNILTRKRTVDQKPSCLPSLFTGDLGNVENYENFLLSLAVIFSKVAETLKPEGRCIVNVMDLRVGSRFLPLHIDLVNAVRDSLVLDDIIIWDRRRDYGNLAPLGFPHKFIVNKVHEYILFLRRAPHFRPDTQKHYLRVEKEVSLCTKREN